MSVTGSIADIIVKCFYVLETPDNSFSVKYLWSENSNMMGLVLIIAVAVSPYGHPHYTNNLCNIMRSLTKLHFSVC